MPSLSQKKQIIYIIAGLLGFAILGFAGYRYLLPAIVSKKPAGQEGVSGGVQVPAPTPPGQEPAGTGQTPPTADPPIAQEEQKLTRITDFPVISPSLNKTEDKILFYKKDGGDLLSSDFRGQNQEKLSNLTIIGLMEAVWSPAHDRAAVFYLDQETIKGFLHIGTSSVAVLPQNITTASWSPDGKSLAFGIRRDTTLAIGTIDASGKNQKTLVALPLPDAEIEWVTQDLISLIPAPSGFAEGLIFTYSHSKAVLTRVLGPFLGLTATWAPNTSVFFASATRESGKRLGASIRDADGKFLSAFPATIAQKCAWSGANIIYCAVPRSLPESVSLPDDYMRGEFNSSDRIISFDRAKKETKEIMNEGNFDMENLIIAKDKKFLFFVSRIDGTLWSLRINE